MRAEDNFESKNTYKFARPLIFASVRKIAMLQQHFKYQTCIFHFLDFLSLLNFCKSKGFLITSGLLPVDSRKQYHHIHH